MERLKRYNKQMVAIMCAFVILVGGVLSTSFGSKAQEYYEMYLNYAEPATSSTQGYLTLILESSIDGSHVPTTFFWNTGVSMHGSGEAGVSYADITLTNSGSDCTINVTVAGHTSVAASGYYTLYEIETSGRMVLKKHTSSERFIHTWSGWNIVSWKLNGNGYCHGVETSTNKLFNVFFNTDNSAVLLMELIATLSHTSTINQSILNSVNNILNSVNDVEGQLSSVISYLQSVDSELDSIKSELQELYNKADEILNEQKKQTTWLEKIWNSIQEFFNPSDEEKTDSEQFDSETTEKSDEIGGLVEESKTEKPDVEDMSNSIDSNLDMTSANEYGAVLLNITENEYILQMLLIVVTVAIIAYVLFGKR